MADHGRQARRDRAADAAFVLVSAAGGLLLLITRAGAHGDGWVPGPHGLAVAVRSPCATGCR